ncbi:MAG: lipopolysaccharide heptosyltransferase II [bacterium]|nr:lipopolysaccharide heptosyltransferase II [bacterium]
MRKAFLNKTPEKILIIRMSSIGDILLTTPVIRLLKKKFPESKIDFVIKKQFAQVLADHPQIDKFYLFDKHIATHSLRAIKKEIRQQQYDLIVDLHKNIRSYFLTIGSRAKAILHYNKGIVRRFCYVKFRLKLFKKIVPTHLKYINSLQPYEIEDDHQGLEFYLDTKVTDQIRRRYGYFCRDNNQSIIGIVPGAHHPTKRWTSEGFSAVINHLVDKGNCKIILFGNQDDRKIVASLAIHSSQNILNTAGELSLRETGALMSFCHAVVTNDSGLLHLATALKKKVIAIFGSTTEELGFFPYLTEHIIVQNNSLTCRPCSHIGRKKCPKKHFKCMKDISAGQVVGALENILART